MKRNSEKEYYAWLERIIKDEKAESFFFKEKSDSYFMDLEMLFEHVQKKAPNILDRLFSKYVDINQLENSDDINVADFTAKLEKGSIVHLKDKDGNELYYLNQGYNFLSGKTRIRLLSNLLNKEDFEILKKTCMGKVLKQDISKIYKKIQRESLKKEHHSFTKLPEGKEVKEQRLKDVSSGFEHNFKKNVLQNISVDPKSIAIIMFKSMSKGDRKDINEAFGHLSVSAFNSLLSKWKYEAIDKEKTVSIKSISKSKDEITQGR